MPMKTTITFANVLLGRYAYTMTSMCVDSVTRRATLIPPSPNLPLHATNVYATADCCRLCVLPPAVVQVRLGESCVCWASRVTEAHLAQMTRSCLLLLLTLDAGSCCLS